MVRGYYAKAEPLLNEALSAGIAIQGEAHTNTLLTAAKLVDLYQRQGRYAEAEALASRAMTASQQAHGMEQPQTQTAMSELGSVLRREGEYRRAIELFTTVLNIQQRVLGSDHLNTLATLAALARTEFDARDYVAAEPALRQVIASYQKVAPDSWSRYDSECLLGAVLAARHDYTNAEPLLVSGYDGLNRVKATISILDRAQILTRAGDLVLQLYREAGQSAKLSEWQLKLAKATQQ